MSVNQKGFVVVEGEERHLTYYLATGSGCSAGDAMALSGTAGYITMATAGTTRVVTVAVETIASSTSATEQAVQGIDLACCPRFSIACNAAPTAGDLQKAHCLITNAHTLDPDSTPATTGIFLTDSIDNRRTNAVIGRFVKTLYSNDRV